MKDHFVFQDAVDFSVMRVYTMVCGTEFRSAV